MADRRRIVALGMAGVVLVIQLMQPSEIISIPLLLVCLFLVAWGIIPDVIRRWAERSGWAASYLLRCLDGLDDLLGNIVPSTSEREESLDRLSYKMEDGIQILNKIVKSEHEFQVWKNDYDDWTKEVSSEIESGFGRTQAVTFRSVGSVSAACMIPYFDETHNSKKLRLNKRIENLRSFLNANSNLDA